MRKKDTLENLSSTQSLHRKGECNYQLITHFLCHFFLLLPFPRVLSPPQRRHFYRNFSTLVFCIDCSSSQTPAVWVCSSQCRSSGIACFSVGTCRLSQKSCYDMGYFFHDTTVPVMSRLQHELCMKSQSCSGNIQLLLCGELCGL